MSWSLDIIRACVCRCLCSLALLSTALAAEYTVSDLGANIQVHALDDHGRLVGTRLVMEQTPAGEWRTAHAARLHPLVDLGAPAGVDFPASDGQAFHGETVVGNAAFPALPGHQAFVLTAAIGYQQLGRLPAQFYSGATGVNAVETISGQALIPQGTGSTTVPVVWVGRVPQVLPLLTQTRAAFEGIAEAMNEAGDMAGHARTATNEEHMVLWPVEGGIRDLDGRPGHQSFGYALNIAQTVVGEMDEQAGAWKASTGLLRLPSLPGLQPGVSQVSQGLGVNEAEDIAGWHSRRTLDTVGLGPTRAVRWRAGQITDLNTLINEPGWILERATVINNAGAIGGTGTLHGEPHAFLLTPIPPLSPCPVALRMQVYGDFNGDGETDTAGVAQDYAVWRQLRGEGWRQLAGSAQDLVVGDFDGDGQEDLAAVGTDTALWLMTDGVHWDSLRGSAAQLVAGDFDANGQTSLVARGGDTRLWIWRYGRGWQQLDGYLTSMAAGDFFGLGYDQLAGTASDTVIWVAKRLGDWTMLNGRLQTVVGGHFAGQGHAQLAGVGGDASIWFAPTLGAWKQVAGNLMTIEMHPGPPGQPDALAGQDIAGTWWYAPTLGAWVQMPGPQVVASGR